MANFYTHYLIADIITKRHPELNKDAFILGNMIVGSEDIEYKVSHLKNPEDILEKYLVLANTKEELSFIYGYYLHLLVDKYYHIKGISTIKVECFKLNPSYCSVIEFINDNIIERYVNFNNHRGSVEVLDDSNFINEYIDILDKIISGWLSPNKQYTTLLMDLDNTIFDFNLGEKISLKNVFNKHGIEFTSELFETYRNVNHDLWKKIEDGLITKDELNKTRFTITFEKMGMSDYISLGPLCGDEYRQELNMRHDYIPKAKDALELLNSKYSISIITNGVSETQRSRMSLSDILTYVDNVFISSDIGYEKPNTKFFRYVLNEIEEKNISKMLVIGDSLSSDIKGANASHIDAIWINNKYKNTDCSFITMMPSISTLYTFLTRNDL